MMRTAVVSAICLLAACELPPLALRFALTDGESQQCMGDNAAPTTSCSDVTMLCDAVLSVRIVPPGDPDVPYVSLCRPLTGAQRKLCSIAGIDLPQPTVDIPEQVLEVQMAVFPRSAVGTDPESGELICPRVEFAANGLPILVLPACTEADPAACPRVPAVGGRTFYTPGDTETVVELGCSDLDQLQNELTCEGIRRINVTASVNNFDDLVSSVDKALADSLTVGIGEPKPSGADYVLRPADSRELLRSATAGQPAWSAELTDLTFSNYVCIEVLADGAQSTTAVTCRAADNKDTIDMLGYYLDKDTLDTVLDAALAGNALMTPGFPDEGLVIGLVVDEFFNPLPNVAVSCGGCKVHYLTSNEQTVVETVTSDNGIFLSTNAPFGTGFTIPSTVLRPVLGGRIANKVTIVVIQDKLPIGP